MSNKQRDAHRAERAAAVQREMAARERRRRLLIGLVVVVVLAAIVTGGVLLSGGGDSPTSTATPKAAVDGQALVVGDDPEATRVVVYEDFLCPYCREFESASRDFLRQDAANGKVVVEYRPFHLLQDDYSTRALSAWAAVAQQGTPAQALRFHDLLFENQPYEQDTDKPGVDELAALAKKAGVTDPAVLAAVKEPDQAFVDAADAAASKAGVKGTPTVLVDGQELTGSSIADMADELEQQLAEK